MARTSDVDNTVPTAENGGETKIPAIGSLGATIIDDLARPVTEAIVQPGASLTNESADRSRRIAQATGGNPGSRFDERSPEIVEPNLVGGIPGPSPVNLSSNPVSASLGGGKAPLQASGDETARWGRDDNKRKRLMNVLGVADRISLDGQRSGQRRYRVGLIAAVATFQGSSASTLAGVVAWGSFSKSRRR